LLPWQCLFCKNSTSQVSAPLVSTGVAKAATNQGDLPPIEQEMHILWQGIDIKKTYGQISCTTTAACRTTKAPPRQTITPLHHPLHRDYPFPQNAGRANHSPIGEDEHH
jgi:hypothetical protein